MEELLIVIIQFIFEILLQVLAGAPWDFYVVSREVSSNEGTGSGLWVVLSLVAGAGIGAASLLIFPTTLLHWGSLRMANLIVAPAISVFVSIYFSRLKTRRGGSRAGSTINAVCAACFTFALALVRFAYAERPNK